MKIQAIEIYRRKLIKLRVKVKQYIGENNAIILYTTFRY